MILITGAGGTCGRELLRVLSDAGLPFRAGYFTATKAEDARSRGIDAVVADFRRTATLGPALRGIYVRHIVKLSVWDAGGEAFSFARASLPWRSYAGRMVPCPATPCWPSLSTWPSTSNGWGLAPGI